MDISNMRVTMVPWAYRRGQEVMYLVVDGTILKNYGELIKRAPDDAFFNMVEKHINAYMEKGVMPPAEIAPAILNAVDDMRAGRKIALRAGDYISLQNYIKK